MHEVRKIVFPATDSKKKIEEHCNEIASRYGDYGKLPGRIRWLDGRTFSSRKEAEDYIDEHDTTYAQIAVKFLEYPVSVKPSKKMLSSAERIERELQKLREYIKKHSVKTFKSAYIGCPHCGSKLNKELLNGEICPLCRTDLRGKTTLETIDKYQVNIKKLCKQYEVETAANNTKNKKLAEEKWLVKIEYHC